jgi:medium-chain acyl-[acyl-carrier-protein] hydrolase
MAKTFEYSMKIPFDMSDVNGYIKIPQLILLSLQVSGMQSIELGMSDMYILENYNLVDYHGLQYEDRASPCF